MRRIAALLLLLSALAMPSFASKGRGNHRSSNHHSRRASDSRAKTVHVRSYTRKDGTRVRAYDRRAPKHR